MQAEQKKVREFRVADKIDVEIPLEVLSLVHRNMYLFTENWNEVFSRGDFLVLHNRQQVWHYYESLDSLDRNLGYVKSGYGWNGYRNEGQIGLMLKLMSICTDLNGRVRSWSRLTPEERSEYTREALAAKEELSRVVHEEKLQMAWRIGAASFNKDKRGRINPGKSAAQLIAAAGNGYRLYRAMVSICGHMEDRHVVVRKLIAREEHRMRLLHVKVTGLINEVLRTGTHDQSDHIFWLIDKLVLEMKTVHFEPWRSAYRRCIQDDLLPAKTLLGQGKVEEAITRLRRVKLVLEFLEFEREYADWMRRAFIEMDRKPVLERKKQLHVLELQNLFDELQLMRSSILSEAGNDEQPVNVDKVLRSHVLRKFYKRTGVGLFYWQQRRFARAKDCFRHADAAW